MSLETEIDVDSEEGYHHHQATAEVKPLERLPFSTAGKARNKLSRSPIQVSPSLDEDNSGGPGWWKAASRAGELAAAASTAAWTAGSWTAGMVAANLKASLGRASDETDTPAAVKPKETSVKVQAMLVEEETLHQQGRDLQSLRLQKQKVDEELGKAQAKQKKKEEEGEHLRAKVKSERRNRDEVAALEERLARLRA